MKPGGITFLKLISSRMLFTPTATTHLEQSSLWQAALFHQDFTGITLVSGANDNSLKMLILTQFSTFFSFVLTVNETVWCHWILVLMQVIFCQSFLLASDSFIHLFEPVLCFNLLDPFYDGYLISLFILLTLNDSPHLGYLGHAPPPLLCCEVGFLSNRVVAPALSVKVWGLCVCRYFVSVTLPGVRTTCN